MKEKIFKEHVSINKNSQVIFVSDYYSDDLIGGAELSTDSLIETSPYIIQKIKSEDVTMDLLKEGHQKFWVFFNFSLLRAELIPTIIANINYCIVEYDYKFCRFRSPEKHKKIDGNECDCSNHTIGKIVSSFFLGSKAIFWMSEKQKNVYLEHFPFLSNHTNIILSSLFSRSTLEFIQSLNNERVEKNDEWVVLGSSSWIKNTPGSEEWCLNNNKKYKIVQNISYSEMLKTLSASKGFVYLPVGGDTCPRIVIEAKLLGCELVLNDFVQHKDEEWFLQNNEQIYEYLLSNHSFFWNFISSFMNYSPTVSSYLTTLNCTIQDYPYEECIQSVLSFSDEVCVVDGGSWDGTWERLQILANGEPRLKIKQIIRDWSDERHALFDGMQKAEARKMCTSDFCWQIDSDEIVHEDHSSMIKALCKAFPKTYDLIALPVIEYWGSEEKVRVDIMPWKWRLSRNKSTITHGIPKELRTKDSSGKDMALPGTDGCDPIDLEGNRVPFLSFYSTELDKIRNEALAGDKEKLIQYQAAINDIVKHVPGVFHYSWFDLERKIKLYRNYWQNHWNSLWGKNTEDTAENNMMFNVPWKNVTDEMIKEKARELKEKIGGWIWHQKWDGKTLTPHIKVEKTQPKYMRK